MQAQDELQKRLKDVCTQALMGCKKEHIDEAIKLINDGAKISPENYISWSLFINASFANSLRLAKLLLEKGLKVTDIEPHHENTLLHLAADGGSAKIVKHLLELGADASAMNKKNRTAKKIAEERINTITDPAKIEKYKQVVEALQSPKRTASPAKKGYNPTSKSPIYADNKRVPTANPSSAEEKINRLLNS